MGRHCKMLLHSSVLALAAARMSEIVPARSSTGFCIGCSNATNGQIPWQASLQTTGHFCGASIISSTFLNCAAHCKKSSFTANVGDVDNTKGQRISAKKFIAHPRYNGNLIIKDYGVIELSSPITINEFAKPIPLIAGGPLVNMVNGQYHLIGATSWAHVNCASYNRPQGWNNLYEAEYNQWVRDNANL